MVIDFNVGNDGAAAYCGICPTSRDPTLNKHIRLFVGKDVDMGVDISGFRFRGLVLRTNFSVSLDKVESEGLAEAQAVQTLAVRSY